MDTISGPLGQKPEEGTAPAGPYEAFKGTELWSQVERAILDLAANNDIIEAGRRDYIVGYICKKVQPLLTKTG